MVIAAVQAALFVDASATTRVGIAEAATSTTGANTTEDVDTGSIMAVSGMMPHLSTREESPFVAFRHALGCRLWHCGQVRYSW